MVSRRAPKGGYCFKEKENYRISVWDWFYSKTEEIENANIVFLPSSEGLEIPIASSLGFKTKNMIAIDSNPAILASALWRREFCDIKCIGNEIVRASERIAETHQNINIVNLDLCSNLNQKLLDDIVSFCVNIPTSGKILFSLTMLEGRESTAVNTLAEIILSKRCKYVWKDYPKRICVVLDHLVSTIKNIGINLGPHGRYKSGKQMMVWGCFEMVADFYAKNNAEKVYKKIFKTLLEIQELKKKNYDLKYPNPYRPESRPMQESRYKKWVKTAEKIRSKTSIVVEDINVWYRESVPKIRSNCFPTDFYYALKTKSHCVFSDFARYWTPGNFK